MSKLIGWEEDIHTGGNSGGPKVGDDGKPRATYVKIQEGESRTLRIVGKPIKFLRYFENNTGKWNRVVVEEEHQNDNPIKLKYGKKPEVRYAVNVIDRKDGVFKIWEFTHNVYKYFVTWADAAKKEPGGPDGPDFVATRTVTPGGKTQYVMKSKDVAPFSETEVKYIKETKIFKLPEIYAPTPLEDMERILYGTTTQPQQSQSQQVVDNKPEQQAAKQPAAAQATVSAEDLNF